MSALFNRTIHFAGNTVRVEFDDPRAGQILDLIIYPFESPGAAAPRAAFRMDVSPQEPVLYTLHHNGNKIYESSGRADTAEMLLSVICHDLAEESRGGMLFHAAGLVWRGQGFLIPGGIAAGKSTFTAWMVSLGAGYLTDELVYIPWETNTMISFARPLHLKKPSRPILSVFLNYDTPGDVVLAGTVSDLVSPAVLAPASVYCQPPVKTILFPHYQAQGGSSWQPLTPAQTGLELMQCLINARNLPDHGFSDAARLARCAAAVKISYSNFSQIEDQVKSLLQA